MVPTLKYKHRLKIGDVVYYGELSDILFAYRLLHGDCKQVEEIYLEIKKIKLERGLTSDRDSKKRVKTSKIISKTKEQSTETIEIIYNKDKSDYNKYERAIQACYRYNEKLGITCI
jgi:hypothetical protein